jgi:hypothetical protein
MLGMRQCLRQLNGKKANVLRPLAAGQRLAPEAFDKLLDEISDVKHQLASKLATASKKK